MIALRAKHPTADPVLHGVDLAGRTVLLTGCTSGLGFETMRVLAARGARVIGAARVLQDAAAAGRRAGGQTIPLECDLGDFASVRRAVDAVLGGGFRLDCVIANAGIMMLPRLELAHGLERQFVVNYLGHFLLINGVLGAVPKHEGGRIVIVASGAHRRAPSCGVELDNLTGARGYDPARAYGQSNVARILFARALARRLGGDGIVANSLRPGLVRGTRLFRHANPMLRMGARIFGRNVARGAATQCYLAAHPDGGAVSGAYFSDCRVSDASAAACDDSLAERLWSASEELLAVHRR